MRTRISPHHFLLRLFGSISGISRPLGLVARVRAITSSVRSMNLGFSSCPRSVRGNLGTLFASSRFHTVCSTGGLHVAVGGNAITAGRSVPTHDTVSL